MSEKDHDGWIYICEFNLDEIILFYTMKMTINKKLDSLENTMKHHEEKNEKEMENWSGE